MKLFLIISLLNFTFLIAGICIGLLFKTKKIEITTGDNYNSTYFGIQNNSDMPDNFENYSDDELYNIYEKTIQEMNRRKENKERPGVNG